MYLLFPKRQLFVSDSVFLQINCSFVRLFQTSSFLFVMHCTFFVLIFHFIYLYQRNRKLKKNSQNVEIDSCLDSFWNEFSEFILNFLIWDSFKWLAFMPINRNVWNWLNIRKIEPISEWFVILDEQTNEPFFVSILQFNEYY